MKVFNFAGQVVRTSKDITNFDGSFALGKDGVIIGLMLETTGKYTHERAIKGLYNEATGELLFIKLEKGYYNPEIYIFPDKDSEGWMSSYHINYENFSVYSGRRNGVATLFVLQGLDGTFERNIKQLYANRYCDSSDLSKKLVADIERYQNLFQFIGYFKGSAQ